MQASSLSTNQLLHQGEIRWIPTTCPACPHAILSIIHCKWVSCNKRNYPEVIARGGSRLELTWARRWQIVMASSVMIDVTLTWVSQSCRFVLLERKKFILHYFYDSVTAFDLQSTNKINGMLSNRKRLRLIHKLIEKDKINSELLFCLLKLLHNFYNLFSCFPHLHRVSSRWLIVTSQNNNN